MAIIVTCLVAVAVGAVATLLILTIIGVRRDIRNSKNPEGK